MSLLSCSDDTEELDKAAAAPTIQFPMEELNIDLNKADNLPVVAIVKSSVGLKEVRMTIQREGSSEEYKSVTSFFNPNSYSLAESLNYEADYKSFVVEAIDKLDRVTSATLFFLLLTSWSNLKSFSIRKRLSMMKWRTIRLCHVLILQ